MRINQNTAADLRWYFITAPGEIGLKSNFGAMVSQLSAFGARSGGAVHIDERKLHAAERARKIEDRLRKAPRFCQQTLMRAFSVWTDDESLVEVLMFTAKAKAEWKKSKTNRQFRVWLERMRDNARHDVATGMKWLQLRREAESCIEFAVEEF